MAAMLKLLWIKIKLCFFNCYHIRLRARKIRLCFRNGRPTSVGLPYGLIPHTTLCSKANLRKIQQYTKSRNTYCPITTYQSVSIFIIDFKQSLYTNFLFKTNHTKRTTTNFNLLSLFFSSCSFKTSLRTGSSKRKWTNHAINQVQFNTRFISTNCDIIDKQYSALPNSTTGDI